MSSPAIANNLQDKLNQCMQVNDSLQRLHCFETVTRQNSNKTLPSQPIQQTNPVSPPTRYNTQQTAVNHYQLQPGEATIGQWEIDVANSALRQDYKLTAINKSVNGRNQYASPILMKLSCDNGSSSLKIIWGEDMVSDKEPTILIDQKSSKLSANWNWSDKSRSWLLTESTGQFLTQSSTAETITAIAEMFDQEHLENYDSGEIYADFSMLGTQKMLQTLAGSCGF